MEVKNKESEKSEPSLRAKVNKPLELSIEVSAENLPATATLSLLQKDGSRVEGGLRAQNQLCSNIVVHLDQEQSRITFTVAKKIKGYLRLQYNNRNFYMAISAQANATSLNRDKFLSQTATKPEKEGEVKSVSDLDAVTQLWYGGFALIKMKNGN